MILFLYMLMMGFLIGLIGGYVIGRGLDRTDGIIIVDDSNEEKTQWILDVKTNPDDIPKKKKISLRVHIRK